MPLESVGPGEFSVTVFASKLMMRLVRGEVTFEVFYPFVPTLAKVAMMAIHLVALAQC